MKQSEREQDIADAPPIVNLRDPADSTDREEVRIARDLGNAARGLGFFYIGHHGIPQAVIDAAFASAQQFFALPVDRKEALSITTNLDNRGYVGLQVEGLDPADRPDMKEALNIGVARRPDGLDPTAGRICRGSSKRWNAIVMKSARFPRECTACSHSISG
jgi:isopenicillin N synthase-like dioxygenase